jgi:hypothetical protein
MYHFSRYICIAFASRQHMSPVYNKNNLKPCAQIILSKYFLTSVTTTFSW